MATVLDAILKINPNAEVTVNGNNVNNIIWHNETAVISKEDIEAKIPVVEKEMSDAKTAADNKKTSGKQKLKDLGLDDDEIKALMGV